MNLDLSGFTAADCCRCPVVGAQDFTYLKRQRYICKSISHGTLLVMKWRGIYSLRELVAARGLPPAHRPIWADRACHRPISSHLGAPEPAGENSELRNTALQANVQIGSAPDRGSASHPEYMRRDKSYRLLITKASRYVLDYTQLNTCFPPELMHYYYIGMHQRSSSMR